MKSKFIYIAATAVALTALPGCDDAWDYGEDGGEGKVIITTTVRSDVEVASRALTGEELSQKLMLWISGDKGLVRRYNGQSEIPASVALNSGRYVAEAWTGDSVPASFDDKWFKGRTEFNIETGKTTAVDLVCKIANVVASVKYDPAVAEVLSDYTLTVGHVAGSLTFEGDDTRKGYFMMNSRAKDLEWTLAGKLADGSEFTKKGTIIGARPATEYVLNVKYTSASQETGGGYFTVVIDETEINVEDEVVISMAPVIKGIGFDIAQPLSKEAGKVGRRSLYITASAALSSVVLESDYFGPLFNLGGNDFDLLAMSDEIRDAMAAKGVTFIYEYNDAEDISNMKISFEAEMTDALVDGSYVFNVLAEDAVGKTSNAAFTIVVGGDPVHPEEVAAADAWATKVILRGVLTQEGATNIMFNYRKRGVQAWTQAAPTSSQARSTEYTLELTGLEPSTDYEYTLSCTTAEGAEFMSSDIKSFTTASTPQLENAGFEDWQVSKAPYLIYADGGAMFWDSGNHGSATMRKNVTVPDTSVKHGGERSIKLESQFVGIGSIGKFAAGNVFIGKYLATAGTDGILGWGRPFTGRPTALKGYVKYTPGTIEYTDTRAPEYVKGDMDKGILYVALLDGSKAQSAEKDDPAEYFEYPVVVKTKSSKLFDKNGSDVIAYGEIVFSEATAGDGMVEFTVPLEYYRTDIIPTYIVCTASASKGGDYFCGGSSVMYLDDLELIY